VPEACQPIVVDVTTAVPYTLSMDTLTLLTALAAVCLTSGLWLWVTAGWSLRAIGRQLIATGGRA